MRRVHLPMAGVDGFVDLMDDRRTWTSGKGMASAVVAEHAIDLTLVGLRRIPQYSVADHWDSGGARTLWGAHVTVVVAGGLARALLGMLSVFVAECTVVRHRPDPVSGATRLLGGRPTARGPARSDVALLALALTAMGTDTLLVIVSHGGHVVTEDLVQALRAATIAGTALDVTDPSRCPPVILCGPVRPAW